MKRLIRKSDLLDEFNWTYDDFINQWYYRYKSIRSGREDVLNYLTKEYPYNGVGYRGLKVNFPNFNTDGLSEEEVEALHKQYINENLPQLISGKWLSFSKSVAGVRNFNDNAFLNDEVGVNVTLKVQVKGIDLAKIVEDYRIDTQEANNILAADEVVAEEFSNVEIEDVFYF